MASANVRVDAAEARCATLTAALAEYAQHRATCDAHFDNQPCSCGLTAALAVTPQGDAILTETP